MYSSKDISTSKCYSRALFTVSKQEGILNEVKESLSVVVSLLCDPLSSRKSEALSSSVDKDICYAILDKLIFRKHQIIDKVKAILMLLIKKRRLATLPEICRQYLAQLRKYNGVISVNLSTAVELQKDDVAKLHKELSNIFGKEVLIQHKVKPEIIGGVIIETDDMLIDHSIGRTLEKLRNSIH